MPGTAVSFVLTVYNKRRFLTEVLASVAAQEGNFEREVIVVDDGSIDGSRELIEVSGTTAAGISSDQPAQPGTEQRHQSRPRRRLDAACQAARR